jgi:hypothetical protein
MCSQTILALSLTTHPRVSLSAALNDRLRGSLARILSHPPRLEQDGEPTGITSDSRTTPAAILSQGYLLLGGQCEVFFDT